MLDLILIACLSLGENSYCETHGASGLYAEVQQCHIIAALIAGFERLAANPRLARLRMEIDPPVRIHPCGAHIVIYREADAARIEVLRIRHGREDWDEAGR